MTPVESTADRATAVVGAVTKRALSTAGKLTLFGLSTGLTLFQAAKTARDTARHHGDQVVQLTASTPLGRLLPHTSPDDGAEAEAGRIARDARDGGPRPAPSARTSPTPPTRTPAASRQNGSPTAQPAPTPVPSVHEPHEVSEAAKEAGAPGAATAEADAAVESAVESAHIPTDPTRDELPIEGFDNASLASLRARLRSLSLEQLAVLREYEQAHAHRLPVITMLDNRLAKLAADASAEAEPATGRSETAEVDSGPGSASPEPAAPDVTDAGPGPVAVDAS